jgi:hypothetical protein
MLAQKTRRTDRQVRAYEQAAEYLVVPATPERNDWQVIHRSGRAYTADLDAHTCTCPDFQKRGGVCKHQHLARFVADAETPTQERIPAEEEELSPEYAAQLTAELQAETDAEMNRIARARREREALWGPESEWD